MHKQKHASITPVCHSITNVLSSHRVSLSLCRLVMNKHHCLISWHSNTPALCSQLSVSWWSCQEEEVEKPSWVYFDEHSSSGSSTWTTCRTTPEGGKAAQRLVTHSSTVLKLLRIFCKNSHFLSSNKIQFAPCNKLTWITSADAPVSLNFIYSSLQDLKATGQDVKCC